MTRDYTGLMALFSFVAALLFLVCPNLLRRLSKGGDKWLSTRKATRSLEIPRNIDERILKLNKPIGIVILVVGIALVYLYMKG